MIIKNNEGNKEGYEPIYSLVRLKPCSTRTTTKSCLEVLGLDSLRMVGSDEKVFFCDRVLGENTTQKEIFDIIGVELVKNILRGYNGCLLTYGQTGSGKTFTAFGDFDDVLSEKRGIIPRILQSIFREIEKEYEENPTKQFLLKCSFLQIYNEHLYDLLDSSCVNLSLGLDINKDVFVKGLQEVEVRDTREAIEIIKFGSLNRRVASTSMNQESSRSHAVFTVTIQSQEIKDDIKVTRTAKLDLVDLAGSERQKHTNALGATLKESCKINQSLSTLGKVIKALIEKEKPPYRDCLLTHLLSNSLGGNSKTYFLATIHQDADQFFETRSTLLFTQRMQLVQNKAVINEETHETFSQLKEKYLKLLERFEGNADDNKVNFESVKKMNAFLLREKIRMQERIDNYEAVKELDDKTIKSLNQRNQNLKMKVKFLQRRQTKNDWISEKVTSYQCSLANLSYAYDLVTRSSPLLIIELVRRAILLVTLCLLFLLLALLTIVDAQFSLFLTFFKKFRSKNFY